MTSVETQLVDIMKVVPEESPGRLLSPEEPAEHRREQYQCKGVRTLELPTGDDEKPASCLKVVVLFPLCSGG